MKIENAHQPASAVEFSGFGQWQPEAHFGLTKRETFAMNATLEGINFDVMFLSDFIERPIDMHDPFDMIEAKIEFEAKIKVMKADALLKALENSDV